MSDALFQQGPENIYFVRLLKTNILLGKRQAIVLPLTNWGKATEYSIFITFHQNDSCYLPPRQSVLILITTMPTATILFLQKFACK